MKKHPFLAIALLLAASLHFAQGQKIIPALANSSSVVLEESGTISVSPGSFRSISLNISVPSVRPYQQVDYPQAPLTDSEGNPYIRISEQNPKNPFIYSKKMEVRTSARKTPSLPAKFAVPNGFSKYLLPTNSTQSDDSEIIFASQQATSGAKTQFEKIARLAIFTNNLLVYEGGMAGQKKDAKWVLENRRGVCTEYSTLFVALARANGIPARYVEGYAYGEKFNGWLGHAWAEAYAGEWVPVDPTWLEVGSLDALHVEEGRYAELSHGQALSATVTAQDAKMNWENPDRGGALANNIATGGIESSPQESNYSLSLGAPALLAGGSESVSLSIIGRGYEVIPVTLSTCTGAASVTVANESQYLILEPGMNATIIWNVTAPASLDEGYVYKCPLTLNSPYLSRKSVAVEINPRANQPDGEANPASSAQSPSKEKENSPPPTLPHQQGNPAPCLPAALIFTAALLIVFSRN